jgi:hypothetical protein
VRDSESLLRRELEARGGRVKQLGTDLVLLEVPTGGGPFTKECTNLLVSCTPLAQMPYLVMVDQDLGYRGADPFLHGVFASRTRMRGWRPLLFAPEHFTQSDLTDVARAMLALLGPSVINLGSLPPGLRDDWGLREAHPPLIGRSGLLEQALAVLHREASRAVPVFVGRAGSGKTALVRELAWRWRSEADGRCAYHAELAVTASDELFPRLCEEALRLGPSALVVVEMLPLAAATPLRREALCRAVDAGLRLCATSPPEGLEAVRDDEALSRRLHPLAIRETSADAMATRVLPAVARHFEIRHGVHVAGEAINVLLRQARTRPGAEPGRSIARLENAVATARRRGLQVLGPDDVLDVAGA